MKLPRYEMGFNNSIDMTILSDSSFSENADSLIRGYAEFIPAIPQHLLNIEKLEYSELVAFNEDVAKILYGPRVLQLFKDGEFEKITQLSETLKERLILPHREIIKSIDFNQIAQVLIRPEARFLTDRIKSFLESQGYEIVLEHPIVVNLQQYWMLYNEGFMKSNLYDFPTRTLVYTCGESKVLILHKRENNLQDHLNSELKGVAGIHSPSPTLRGTVIIDGYTEARNLDEKKFYDSIDPFGMYRMITSGNIPSTDPYSYCEDPVLYYAGQGVHLPEGFELPTNTGVLLSEIELRKLSQRFKN
jgi:hypothetical protein